MTTPIPTPRQHAILRELRYGPITHFAISDEIGSSAFVVRAELKGLRRQLLVSDTITETDHFWRLTEKGWTTVMAADQLELGMEWVS